MSTKATVTAEEIKQELKRLALRDIEWELKRATDIYGPFNSAHEGYAIIKEEVDELWENVKSKLVNKNDMRDEAVQIAAMAIRFIMDLC